MKFKNCQSCSMPLHKAPGRGTNKDGSKSEMYCAYCFTNGEFIQPTISADEMKEFVSNKLKELGFPGFIARFLSKDIPKLKRWKP